GLRTRSAPSFDLPDTGGPRGPRAGRSPDRARASRRGLRQGQEPLQQRLAVAGALLRVVLDAEEGSLADDGGDAHRPMFRDRMRDAGRRLAAVRVGEVRPAGGLERARAGGPQLLPADV